MSQIELLLKGFDAFQAKQYENSDASPNELYTPNTFVIECDKTQTPKACDIFCADPDQFLTYGFPASFIPPYDPRKKDCCFNQALTHAVEGAQVEDIIVLGLAQCPCIHSMLTGIQKSPTDKHEMSALEPAIARAEERVGHSDIDLLCRETEQQAVTLSMRNLMSYPCVQEAIRNGALQIHGWIYNDKYGSILDYNLTTKFFEPLAGINREITEGVRGIS